MKKSKQKKITTTTTTTVTTTEADLKTYVAIVLDRSSSMDIIRSEAVAVFNEQVDAIKKNSKNVETSVSLFTFATQADSPILFNVPATKLEKLKLDEYVPNGMTAMYDSVGMAIDGMVELPDAKDPNTSFLFIIISDGQENCSKKYRSVDIASRIQELQKTGRYTFSYLGANQDLSKVSQLLNIPIGNTMTFTSNSIGTMDAAMTTASATSNYLGIRGQGIAATKDFYMSDDSKDHKVKK